MDKYTFISHHIPDAKDISIVTINLDSTDFTIGDVLRNVNKAYPISGRERNLIMCGDKAVALILKSKFMNPLSGIVLIICGNSDKINILSRNYIVISISESSIRNTDDIAATVDALGDYFRENYKYDLEHFDELYKRYIYDCDIEDLYML